jgi:phosphoenolpyruvate phosphomutase
MAEWGGEVVEPEYTQGISSSEFHHDAKVTGIMPNQRVGLLRKAIEHRPIVRVIEAHSGLSAMVVDNARVAEPGKPVAEYDGIWLSSLTDSTLKGKPDTELVDLSSRLVTVNDILECTTKPIIYDGDTGGMTEHIPFTVRRLERLGVSAIIIEDKTGAKRNSLIEPAQVVHAQDSIINFSQKIRVARSARLTSDFMVIARIESLITGAGMDDALARARAFIDAGADGIMIHSRKSDGVEIFDFCEKYNQWKDKAPLVAVPTNYSSVSEAQLIEAGISIVIYANQMLRSSYTSMLKTAETILHHERAYEADKEYVSSLELIKLIEGNS